MAHRVSNIPYIRRAMYGGHGLLHGRVPSLRGRCVLCAPRTQLGEYHHVPTVYSCAG